MRILEIFQILQGYILLMLVATLIHVAANVDYTRKQTEMVQREVHTLPSGVNNSSTFSTKSDLAPTPEVQRNLNISGLVYWDAKYSLFRFNVSWIPPPDVDKVTTISYHYHCIPNCINNSTFSGLAVPNETKLSLPEHHVDHFISLNSTIILTLDFKRTSRIVNFRYKVPYCLGSKCSCEHMKILSKPEVTSAYIRDGQMGMSWIAPESIMVNGSRLNHVIVNITVYKRIAGDNRERRKFIADYWKALPLNLTNKTILDRRFERDVDYKVSLIVNDSKGCFKSSENFTVQYVIDEEVPKESVSIWLPLGTGLCVMIGLLLAALLGRSNFCFGINQSSAQTDLVTVNGNVRNGHPRCRNILRPSGYLPLSMLRRSAIPLEMSVFYVEKHIVDAKARGIADGYEIDFSRLEIGEQIGNGAFGMVYLAYAEAIVGNHGQSVVAVKKLKDKATREETEEFRNEIAMLKKVGRHPNIVTLLACCTLKEPYCMVMEYLPHGDLCRYLRALRSAFEKTELANDVFTNAVTRFNFNRGDQNQPSVRRFSSMSSDPSYIRHESLTSSGRPSVTETEYTIINSEGAPITPGSMQEPVTELECVLDAKELQRFALQIASGMAHIESRQITHRDLAARNVLIDQNRTLKISDFGLSRAGIYVHTKTKQVPLRWLSVEAILDNLYSSRSDVWAFAVVLWEIGTLGAFPYAELEDEMIAKYLFEGKRLAKPDNLSDEIYALMLRCWAPIADERPSFQELVKILDPLSRKKVYVSFDDLNPNYVFPPTEKQVLEIQLKKAIGTAPETESKQISTENKH